MKKLEFLVPLLFVLLACNMNDKTPADKYVDIAIQWKVDSLQLSPERYSNISLELKNNGQFTLTNNNWELHYNDMEGQIDNSSLPTGIQSQHINGDYYKIFPTVDFNPLNPGQTLKVIYRSVGLIQRISDAPNGLFFVIDGIPRLIKDYSIAGINDQNMEELNIPTAKTRYEENKSVYILPQSEIPIILPTPKSFEVREGELLISKSISIGMDDGSKNEGASLK